MVSRATRMALVLAIFPLGLIGWLAWDHGREVQRLEIAGRAAYAQAEALKQDVDARFSPGASRAEIEGFLRSRTDYGDWTRSVDDVWLSTGKTPSMLFGCGPFSVGVRVRFRQEQFVFAKVDAIGLDCP